VLLAEIRPAGTHHTLGLCCGGVALLQGTCVWLISWKDCCKNEPVDEGRWRGRQFVKPYSFCLVIWPTGHVDGGGLIVSVGRAGKHFLGGSLLARAFLSSDGPPK
jgi:hypothetical protein